MQLKQIQLKHIACFHQQSIDFAHTAETGMTTILAGEANSGKTALLRSLYIGLSWFIARLHDPRATGIITPDEDIQHQQLQSMVEITGSLAHEEHSGLDNPDFQWRIFKNRQNPQATGYHHVELEEMLQVVSHYQQQLRADTKAPLPLLAYYPTERQVQDISAMAKPPMLQTQLATYDLNIAQNNLLNRFFEWYREQEDIENEQRANVHRYYFPSQPNEQDADLSTLLSRLAISQQHFLGRNTRQVNAALSIVMPELSNFRVQRSPQLTFMVDLHGKSIPIHELSYGSKVLLATIGDIVRRLCSQFPASINPIQEGNGVIIIDEIELHLSTEQQKHIIERLQQAFPNCQLIVSTQSESVYLGQYRAVCYALNHGQISRVNTDYHFPQTHDISPEQAAVLAPLLTYQPQAEVSHLQQLLIIMQHHAGNLQLQHEIAQLVSMGQAAAVQQLIALLHHGLVSASQQLPPVAALPPPPADNNQPKHNEQ